jgi:hypothetical protein
MEERIENLFQNFQSMPEDDVRRELEAWDRDQGRAMRKSEKEISIPKKQYEWSPNFKECWNNPKILATPPQTGKVWRRLSINNSSDAGTNSAI